MAVVVAVPEEPSDCGANGCPRAEIDPAAGTDPSCRITAVAACSRGTRHVRMWSLTACRRPRSIPIPISHPRPIPRSSSIPRWCRGSRFRRRILLGLSGVIFAIHLARGPELLRERAWTSRTCDVGPTEHAHERRINC